MIFNLIYKFVRDLNIIFFIINKIIGEYRLIRKIKNLKINTYVYFNIRFGLE